MGTVTKGKSYKYTLCTGHLDLIIVTIAMAKGCVLHYLSVIAVLSLSLLNQGWGVPKHYLVETKDGDNFIVGTQKDDNYVVGTQDDDNHVVGIHDNLARTDHVSMESYESVHPGMELDFPCMDGIWI